MRTLPAVVLLLLFCPSFLIYANAQTPQEKWQAFAGYAFSRQYGMLNPFSLNRSGNGDEFAPFNENGEQVEVSYFPTAHFGATYQMSFLGTGPRTMVFHVSYNGGTFYVYFNGPQTYTLKSQRYMIGPAFRYTLKRGAGRTTLFVHQLFGSIHDLLKQSNIYPFTDSGFNFAMASGGGVDFKVSRLISVRPIQMDFVTEQIGGGFYGNIPANQSVKFGVDGFNYSGGALITF